MKLIVFDVGNAFCSIISSPNNVGMMIDCGSNNDKTNPVDLFIKYREWLDIRPIVLSNGKSYPLGLLHITHPDGDHVRNASRIISELAPYLVRRRKFEEFPENDDINEDYIKLIDKVYRGSNPEPIDWGFNKDLSFQIPMPTLINNPLLSAKIKNNSSILRFIEYNGVKILFSGDLETPGWEWLINNDQSFVDTISSGINIFIAPHHGHKSGFPTTLFEKIPSVDCVIHSKGSEGSIEETDVSNLYSSKANGVIYKSLRDKSMHRGKVLTTRSNGSIFFEIESVGNYNIWTEKSSSRHERVIL